MEEAVVASDCDCDTWRFFFLHSFFLLGEKAKMFWNLDRTCHGLD